MGDGLEMLSPTKIVVAGSTAARRVEISDDWETATATGRYVGSLYRIASAATVKDEKVYINHLVGGGLRKRIHVIADALSLLWMSSEVGLQVVVKKLIGAICGEDDGIKSCCCIIDCDLVLMTFIVKGKQVAFPSFQPFFFGPQNMYALPSL